MGFDMVRRSLGSLSAGVKYLPTIYSPPAIYMLTGKQSRGNLIAKEKKPLEGRVRRGMCPLREFFL